MMNHKSQGATITTKVIINIKNVFECKQGKNIQLIAWCKKNYKYA
jgi:hypothetical protein